MNTPYRKLPARTVAVLLASALALSVAPGQVAVAEPLPQVPAGLPAELPAASSAFAKRLEGKYIDPDRVYSTDVRWWLGEASNTDESLLEEIQALYDAGFRGVELCMQADNAAPDADYAYGSAMWTHKWNLMMNKLLDLGMAVYLTSGTNWSTSNVPGLDPTSQAAMQNLTMGSGTVAAGESVSVLPAPDPAKDQRAGAKFVTAYAYRIVQGDTIDPDSYVNLGKITQGTDVWTQNVNWTAPDDGTYRIFGFWTQGTWQASSPSAETSYATNYFDERGVAALKTFWEDHYLKDPALVAKMKKGDVQLFMDSLEISAGGGVQFTGSVLNSPQFTWWAEDIAAQFKARKGYDIMPYMFLIRGVKSNVYNPYDSVATTGLYRIQGQEDRRQEIINDWQDVLTEL
ncbi:MAG: hypothetical protein VB093_13630 [Propionicimonas sp.]|nr:hypothetical protein [Propionicimonas sp.]